MTYYIKPDKDDAEIETTLCGLSTMAVNAAFNGLELVFAYATPTEMHFIAREKK